MATTYLNLGFTNFFQTSLSGSATAADLTIHLVSTTGLPTAGILVIDPYNAATREIIYYTTFSTSGGDPRLNLQADGRGWDGTTAVAHGAGTVVIMAPTKSILQGLRDGTAVSDPIRLVNLPYQGKGIVSGGVVTAGTGLSVNITACTYYYLGVRYVSAAGTLSSLTASSTGLVVYMLAGTGTGDTLYAFVGVSSTPPAAAIPLAYVTTNGSNVTAVSQSGQGYTGASDSTPNPIYPMVNLPSTYAQPPAWNPYLVNGITGTTGITTGNGTFKARSYQVGNRMDVICTFTFGSTSAITANPTIGLPRNALATTYIAPETLVGQCTIYDVSATTYYYGFTAIATATPDRAVTRLVNTASTYAGNTAVSSTVPMTFATGDIITWQFSYECDNGTIFA